MKKYIVTDPKTGERWTYEQSSDGSWDFTQPKDGPPDVEITLDGSGSLIERVLQAHRVHGRTVKMIEE